MNRQTVDERVPHVLEDIELDEEAALQGKARRRFQVEAIQTPKLRFLAFGFGALLVLIHNRVILGQPGWVEFRIYVTTLLIYGFGSWALLYRFYGRTGTWDLSLVFLVLDVVLLILGIHLSGLERSWLFPLLLIRVGDQAHTTFRRALTFAFLVPAAYVGWLLIQARPVPWAQELFKAAALLTGGIYLASTTLVVEAMRRRTKQAIRVSRELIQKLDLERQKALYASQAKSDFLSAVSHDLRTPLNAILLYSQLVEEDAQASERNDIVADMQKIQGAGTHLLQLLNNLLDLAKIEAGKLSLYMEDIDLPVLVEDVVSLAIPLVHRNRNDLHVEVDPALGGMSGDPTRLRQILLNLLGNAAKFTTNGQITLRIYGLDRGGQPWLAMSVSDTGIGMTEEQSSKVFQEFVQAEANTARTYGGTGLGLALCKQLTRLMEGEIHVRSEVNRGSTFTVEMPFHPPTHEFQEMEALPAFSGQLGVVLVIEDDPDFREGLTRLLQGEGFTTLEASTGETGLDLARTSGPDLITLDVSLPGLSGFEVLAALKADPYLASIPVILLTLSEDRSQGFALGASDFIPKPIEPRKCVELVRRHLTRTLPGTVLLVEDDLSLRGAIARTLEPEGWAVLQTGDGHAALAYLERGALPDLVLLDLNLPGMDGFQFLQVLRETPAWKEIPVIVATGMDLGEAQRRYLADQGVQDFIDKGAQPREALMQVVGDLARRGILRKGGYPPPGVDAWSQRREGTPPRNGTADT